MDYRAFPILYVDDERANRVVMKHNLGKDFTLHIVESADAALDVLASASIAVLLADQRMPKVTGVDLAEMTRQRHPDVVRVIITAYSDLEATIEAINRAQVSRFIKKPWTREELVVVMKESIHAFESARLIKQLQARLIQLDRMSSVAILSASIAHDLKQPMTYIDPILELLLDDAAELGRLHVQPPDAARAAARIRGGVRDLQQGLDQIRAIATALLQSLAGEEPSTDPIDLTTVVHNARALTRRIVDERGNLEVHQPVDEVLVRAAEGRLYQLVVNLLLNAVHSLDAARKVANRIDVRLGAQGDRVIIEIEDTGCGIPEAQLADVFKPFFTTKGEGGSGLGLAICKQIVDELGGTIAVRSRVGAGTCFTVSLPRAR